MNPYNSPRARCCVFDCAERVQGRRSKFHKFPSSKALLNGESLRQRWINAVKITKKLSKDMVVCHRHFKKEDYIEKGGRRKLKVDAVPSQHLPTVWRNKFYPRDYGRLVKLVEVRGIGRLRLCFEAKLGRRLRQSQEKKREAEHNRIVDLVKALKKKVRESVKAGDKNEDGDEVTIVPSEDASGTKKQTVPVPLPPIPSSTDPFTSEIDIKDEPLSETEETIEDILAKMNDEPMEPKGMADPVKQSHVISKAPCGVCEAGACKCKEKDQSAEKVLSKSGTVSCSSCMIGFSSAELLAVHNKTLHTKPSSRPFVCMLCNDSFKAKVELMEHVAGHAIINSFKCKVCAQYFLSKEDRDDHFRGHRIVRKEYVCRECKAVLKTRAACWDHLNNHIRSRLKTAGIPCEVCGRVLSTRITLKEHMLIHSGEKPFECQLCGRKIRHRTNFLLHVQGHTLGLPHQCGSCGMSFLKKSELNIHVSNEHPELKDYNCSICGVTFKTESRFIKHAISHNAQLEE